MTDTLRAASVPRTLAGTVAALMVLLVRTTPPTSQTLSSSDGSTSTRAVQTTRPELPPSSTASVPVLASIHPCELVEEEARSELGLSEPDGEKTG